MADTLLSYVVSDLCLGKPPLRSLSITSSTVADALTALKSSEDTFISVWSCCHDDSYAESATRNGGEVDGDCGNHGCRCVGKICMVDIVCYLCKEENLESPSSAMESPVSVVLAKSSPGFVKHVDPDTSLVEAIDDILDGAHNLIVPIKTTTTATATAAAIDDHLTTTVHAGGRQFCWLTPYDVVSFLLSRISLFSPLPFLSISSLGLVNAPSLSVDHRSPASSAVELISRSVENQSSVAVLDDDGSLMGEISPLTLSSADETLAPAMMSLSASDLLSFIDSPTDQDLIHLIRSRLKESKLDSLRSILDDDYSSSASAIGSSDDEELSSEASTTSSLSSSDLMNLRLKKRYRWSGRKCVVCGEGSSVIAVMIQATAHRLSYVWVVDDDGGVVGVVRFRDVLEVFRETMTAAAAAVIGDDEWSTDGDF